MPPNIRRTIAFEAPVQHFSQFPQQQAFTPPRWPYRRPSDVSTNPGHPSPLPNPVHYSPVTPQRSSLAEHLPSIGSFLGKKAPSIEQKQSSLPSLNTIMAHLYHQNFSALPNTDMNMAHSMMTPGRSPVTPMYENTPHNVMTPQMQQNHQTPGSSLLNNLSPEISKIHLKSYASHQNGHFPLSQELAPQHQILPPVEKREVYSDSEDNFIDSSIGGVAIAATHGSVIMKQIMSI